MVYNLCNYFVGLPNGLTISDGTSYGGMRIMRWHSHIMPVWQNEF